jgi:hypothetical protein
MRSCGLAVMQSCSLAIRASEIKFKNSIFIKMKWNINHFCSQIVIILIFLCSCTHSFGQDKLNIAAGIGFPELVNIGARYQHRQTQFGMNIGSFPSATEAYLSVSGDVYYHFGGFSGLSIRRPWYGRIGLNYLRREDKELYSSSKYSYSYLQFRVGRDFNISKKFGIDFDLGIGIQILNTERSDIPVMPFTGLVLFYRL